jgi:hypothetical protein
MTWLAVGVAAGLCISYFWPHEPALAVTTDRDSKFAMATIALTPIDTVEGIFVLDFLTGQLTGAVLNNKMGKFMTQYSRNIAVDFQVDPKAEPHYAIVSGLANLPSGRGVNPATGVIYIGELTSGKVICYSFPVRVATQPQVSPLTPIDFFQFREPVVGE